MRENLCVFQGLLTTDMDLCRESFEKTRFAKINPRENFLYESFDAFDHEVEEDDVGSISLLHK